MAGLWHKAMHAFGFGPEDAEYDEVEVEDTAALQPEPALEEQPDMYSARGSGRRGTLVSLPSQTRQSFRVLVVEPRSFEEVQTIADQLKGRRPVILNLESLDKDLAQRILNFLNGAVYALGGETQRVSGSIFFFAPPGVDVGTLGRGYTGAAIGGGSLDAAAEGPAPVYDTRPLLSKDPLENLLARHRQAAAAAEGEVAVPAAEPGRSAWENWRR